MKAKFFAFILLFVFGAAHAQYSWKKKADFPSVIRDNVTGFAIGNKGYACGGAASIGFIHYSDLWEYDPFTDTWTQKANLPGQARAGALGFTIGNKGYVGLGETNSA